MEELRNDIYEALTAAKVNLTALHDQIKDKHLIVFLGKTRSGKSTLINSILGTELQSYKKRKNVYKIKKVDEHAYGPDIGQGIVSKTAIPGFYKLNGFSIVDAPGFEDNRGEAQVIINAIYINQIQHASTCRFVLISDINDIVNDSVDCFLKFINEVNELIPNIDILKKSISLILTKDSDDYTPHEIALRIEEEIIQNSDLKISEKDRELLKYFATNESSIAFFKMPTQEGKIECEVDVNIKKALKKSTPACLKGYRVGFVISSDVRVALLKVCQESIDILEIESKVAAIVTVYQNFVESEFLTASSDKEVTVYKTYLNQLSTKLSDYQDTCSELQDVLDSLTDLISLDPKSDLYATLTLFIMLDEASDSLTDLISLDPKSDLYATLRLFIMLDEASLVSSQHKDAVIAKYKEALQQLCIKVDCLKSKLSNVERARKNSQRRKRIMKTLSTSAVVVGTVAAATGESALTAGVVGLACTGVGMGLVVVGVLGVFAITYVKKKKKQKRNRAREQQGRPLL